MTPSGWSTEYLRSPESDLAPNTARLYRRDLRTLAVVGRHMTVGRCADFVSRRNAGAVFRFPRRLDGAEAG